MHPIYNYSKVLPVGCFKRHLYGGKESCVLLHYPHLPIESQTRRYLLLEFLVWQRKSLLHLVNRAESSGFCCGTLAQRQETGHISPHAVGLELGCPEGSGLALKQESSWSKGLQFYPKSCNFMISGHLQGSQQK